MRTVHLFAAAILAVALTLPSFAEARDKEVEALIQDLSSPDKSDAAMSSLQRMGKKAVRDIKEVLEEGQLTPDVVTMLVKVLVKADDAGLEALASLLSDATSGRTILENLKYVPANAAVEGALVEVLRNSKNGVARLAALVWLEEKSTRTALLDVLVEQLGGSDVELRTRMATAVAVRGGVAVGQSLMEELRVAESNKSPANLNRRLGIIEALGWIAAKYPAESSRILPTLVQALGDPDEQKAAMEGIVRVGGKASPALLMVLKAGDTTRAAPAMEALLSIGKEAAPEVVALLEARHPKIRELAHQFLCFYQDPAILPLLKALYKRSKPEDRASMLEIIGLYGTDDAWSLVMDSATDENAAVRLEAVKMLGTARSAASVPVLLARAQEDQELPVRMAAIQALFRRGERAAVPVFIKMVEYEKWDVRVALLDALAWLAGPGQVKAIAEQMRHRQSEVASAAERALWNITYLQGQRSPDEWIAEVDRRLAGQAVEGAPEMAVRTFQVAGTEVEYGEAGSGPVVLVLLPSLELTKGVMPKAYSLLALDHHLVFAAFPGCLGSSGESGALASCMRKVAKRLDVLVSRVSPKEPVAVVAQGVTGFAALALYELNASSVSHLVWANPVFPRRYFLEMTWRRAVEKLDARWREEWRVLEGRGGDFVPQAMNRFRSRIEAAASCVEGGGMFAEAFYGAGWLLNEIQVPYEDTSMEVALANVTVPTLLLFGEDDFTKNENMEAFRTFGRIHRNVVTASVANSIRLTPYEQPGVFAATVRRFLDGYKLLKGVAAVGTQRSTAVIAMWNMGSSDGRTIAGRQDRVETGIEPVVSGGGDTQPGKGVTGPGLDVGAGFGPVTGPEVTGGPKTPEGGTGSGTEPVKTPEEGGKTTAGTEPVKTPEEGGKTTAGAEPVKTPEEGGKTTAGAEPVKTPEEGGKTTAGATSPDILDLTNMGSSGVAGGGGVVEIHTGPTSYDWLGWTLVGVGAVALGAGAYFSLQAMDYADQANGLDPLVPGYSDSFDSKYSSAQDQSMFSWIGYGVGALGLLAGLDILLGWPIPFGDDGQSASITIAPTPLAGGGALVVQGVLP